MEGVGRDALTFFKSDTILALVKKVICFERGHIIRINIFVDSVVTCCLGCKLGCILY